VQEAADQHALPSVDRDHNALPSVPAGDQNRRIRTATYRNRLKRYRYCQLVSEGKSDPEIGRAERRVERVLCELKEQEQQGQYIFCERPSQDLTHASDETEPLPGAIRKSWLCEAHRWQPSTRF